METSNVITSSSSRPVLSFGAAYSAMAEQVDLLGMLAVETSLTRCGQMRELVRIAADVYTRRYESQVVVDGDVVTYGYLQEIFKNLTYEHILYVLDRLDHYSQEIRFKKAFIRTTLYNSVFELFNGVNNEVVVDMGAVL